MTSLPSGPIRRPTIEGVLGLEPLRFLRGSLVAEVEIGLDVVVPGNGRWEAMSKCKSASLARGAVIEHAYEWTFGFHWIGDGTTMRLTEILVVPEDWPDFFTDDDKDCWVNAFLGVSFPSTTVVDVTIEFPLRLEPEGA